MKDLLIPFLPSLDSLSMEEAKQEMEVKAARCAVDCCNWKEAFPYSPIVSFDIAYTPENIYIHYFVRGNALRAMAQHDNEYVYEDSCVEFFLRPEEDMRYYNLEFNCIGVAYGAYGADRHGRQPIALDKLAKIRRYTSLQPKPFAEQAGLYSWEIVLAIPFDVVGMDKHALPASIRANVYKCADGTAYPHYLSWNPVETETPDYHRPEYFGRMTFASR